MYGKDARTVVELSGLPTGRTVNEFVGNMIIGDFFELLLMELFVGYNITCRGIHTRMESLDLVTIQYQVL
jgi:hypothetical protein